MFRQEHPKLDQNPKFTPLGETTSIPTPFIYGIPPPVFDRAFELLHFEFRLDFCLACNYRRLTLFLVSRGRWQAGRRDVCIRRPFWLTTRWSDVFFLVVTQRAVCFGVSVFSLFIDSAFATKSCNQLEQSRLECSLRTADAFPGEKRRPEMRLRFAG